MVEAGIGSQTAIFSDSRVLVRVSTRTFSMSFKPMLPNSGKSESDECFCVNKVFGVRTKGESGSEDTGVKGRECTIVVTSAIYVQSMSIVIFLLLGSISMALRNLRTRPIILSQAPPKCDEYGGLKIHFVPES